MPDELNDGAPASGQAPAGQDSGAGQGQEQGQSQDPSHGAAGQQGQQQAARAWEYNGVKVDADVVDTGLWVMQVAQAARSGNAEAVAALKQMFPFMTAEQKAEAKQSIKEGDQQNGQQDPTAELRKKIDQMEAKEKQREFQGRLRSQFEQLNAKHKPESYHKDAQTLVEALAEAAVQRGGNPERAYSFAMGVLAEVKKAAVQEAMQKYKAKSFSSEGPGGAAALPKPAEKPLSSDQRKARIKEKIESGAYDR